MHTYITLTTETRTSTFLHDDRVRCMFLIREGTSSVEIFGDSSDMRRIASQILAVACEAEALEKDS